MLRPLRPPRCGRSSVRSRQVRMLVSTSRTAGGPQVRTPGAGDGSGQESFDGLASPGIGGRRVSQGPGQDIDPLVQAYRAA